VDLDFRELSQLGADHFKTIYKEKEQVTITKVFRMTTFFPSFVGEENN
jgi:hypothetical protein